MSRANKHRIGFYSHKHAGPLLVITAGVHGNEPAGITALRNVMTELEEKEIPIHGAFAGLLANVDAFDKGVRFMDEDLNRIWTDKKVKKIAKGGKLNHEERQVRDLIKTIEELEPKNYEERYHLDLHTTSSESIPYISVSDDKGCRAFANLFPMQDVLGFASLVDGTIDKWFCKNGFEGFTVEAGQHQRVSSIENCEAVIWMALVESGCIDMVHIERFKESRAVLTKFIFDEKKNFRIRYRHDIPDGESFNMEPDFVNFQKVCNGELLAHMNSEAVYSKWDARILMPLYQGQGNDGFFIIEEISL